MGFLWIIIDYKVRYRISIEFIRIFSRYNKIEEKFSSLMKPSNAHVPLNRNTFKRINIPESTCSFNCSLLQLHSLKTHQPPNQPTGAENTEIVGTKTEQIFCDSIASQRFPCSPNSPLASDPPPTRSRPSLRRRYCYEVSCRQASRHHPWTRGRKAGNERIAATFLAMMIFSFKQGCGATDFFQWLRLRLRPFQWLRLRPQLFPNVYFFQKKI